MKIILKTIMIFIIITLTLLSCNKDSNDPTQEQEDNTIPQVNTIVSTFAGNANELGEFEDGQGTDAKFNFPWHIVFDNENNLYVADNQNNAIRKISPTGQVTTFAEGILQPYGMAFDNQGNLFVSNGYDDIIQKITPAGVVSTFAGTGNRGYVDGNSNQAQFYQPQGITFDSQNNLYVADSGNHVIRKITPSGIVTTHAGNGQEGIDNGAGNVATFKGPSDLAFDSQGNLFITDGFSQIIRKMDTNQQVTSFAGPSINGFEWYFYLNGCVGIDIDSNDNLYITIAHGSRVVKITKAGKILNFAGKMTDDYQPGNLDGIGANAEFYRPVGIAINSNGEVFNSDYGNNNIRKIIAQ